MFELRDECILCRGSAFDPVWRGRFDDPDVSRFLRQFHYSSDLGCLTRQDFNLVQCANCGMRFHQRILAPDWIDRLYSEWIDSRQIEAFEKNVADTDVTRAAYEQVRQDIKHLLRLRDTVAARTQGPIRLLDFGCGDGRFLRLAEMLQFESVGVDFSASRKERAQGTGVRIFPDLGSVSRASPGAFHAITLFETLEHLVHPRETLGALTRLLEPGGVMIVTVPDCRTPIPPTTLTEFHNVHPLEHLNCFTPATLTRFVESVGLVPMSRKPAHVTTRLKDVLRTEASRFWQPKTTTLYARKPAENGASNA
ncbi:MAG: class I SAM-dependent methyltransferase [Rhodobacteraceae bacterium]|nr:MAG: class I SAM-dependent methyltransferase [Paracoccaceae bacterium]